MTCDNNGHILSDLRERAKYWIRETENNAGVIGEIRMEQILLEAINLLERNGGVSFESLDSHLRDVFGGQRVGHYERFWEPESIIGAIDGLRRWLDERRGERHADAASQRDSAESRERLNFSESEELTVELSNMGANAVRTLTNLEIRLARGLETTGFDKNMIKIIIIRELVRAGRVYLGLLARQINSAYRQNLGHQDMVNAWQELKNMLNG